MTDSTPPPVSNDPANDGYEIENADEARDDEHSVGKRIKDAIEDVIPGDSDKDGH